MRPTQLNFRSPQERTAEYRKFQINKDGQSLDFLQKQTNNTGSNLPKDLRFKPMPLYCKGSGASCYLGPGSYNDHESFIKLNKQACSTKIVSITETIMQ